VGRRFIHGLKGLGPLHPSQPVQFLLEFSEPLFGHGQLFQRFVSSSIKKAKEKVEVKAKVKEKPQPYLDLNLNLDLNLK
jgi:hypothetical protein